MGVTEGGKRPSRAALQRQRAEVLASRAREPDLPAELQQWLDRYEPRASTVNPQAWAAIQSLHHQVMRRAHVRGTASFREHARNLAEFLAWAHLNDHPLQLEGLLRHALIDEYVQVGAGHLEQAARSTCRSRLRSLASHVNPGTTSPPRPKPVPHMAVQAPYTAAEVAAIVRMAGTQPRVVVQRQVQAAVGLGLGAGLGSEDLRDLTADHLDDRGEEGIWIDVPGPRPRSVVVRACMEGLVRAGMAGLNAGDLVLGKQPGRRNVANKVFEHAVVLGATPRPVQARLRVTWLAAVLMAAVPLPVVMQAAGLTSARTLTDLVAHLEQVPGGLSVLREADPWR